MKPAARVAIAVAGGVLLALSVMPFGVGWFSFFALVPLLWATQDKPPAGAFLWGWLYGGAVFITGLAWFFPIVIRVMRLSPAGSCLVFAALCLTHGLMFAIDAWAGRALSLALARRLGVEPEAGPVLVMVPVIVTVDAYFPQYIPGHLANAWVWHLPMVQSLDLLGMAGLAWLAAGCNVALYLFLRSGARGRAALRWRWLAAAGGLLLANEAYGLVRMRQVDAWVRGLPAERRLRVGIVQGSIPKDERFVPELFERNLGVYRELSRQALQKGPLDFVLWPTATYPWLVEFQADDPGRRRPMVRGLAFEEAFRRDVSVGTPTLVGARSLTWLRREDGRTVYRRYIVSLLTSASGAFLGTSAKRSLTPFSEFMPLERVFPPMRRLKPKNYMRFWRGPQELLSLEDGTRIGSYVCYEELLAGPARRYALSGAQVLAAITADDQERDTAGLELHLLASSLRAIEDRRFLLRAATSGISAVVDPAGRIVQRLGPGEKGFLVAEAARLDVLTPQARLGPLCDMSGAVALAAVFAWVFLRRRKAG